MATVRQQGARRLGVIIGLLLAGGVATAVVRASSNDSTPVHTAQGATTTITEGETVTTAGETTTPSSTEAGAAGSSSGTSTPSGSSGLSSSGSGAAAATSEHPNTGGPLPLLPGLGAIAAGAALRRRR